MFEATADYLRYRSARQHLEHEQRDLCSTEVPTITGWGAVGTDVLALIQAGQSPDPRFARDRTLLAGSAIIGGGTVLMTIPGMGTVYDWRGTHWSPPNGGTQQPIIFVQHIPVVPNMVGIADFVRLRDVLVAQGLMVQNATDKDGNVALYTHMNRLCYQARGANQMSCGTEHMHMTVGEEWSRRQLRASAWLVNQAKTKYGLPAGDATLKPGPGVVRVAGRGQTTHEEVSNAAGYHDRIDPGKGYDREYVYKCVVVYRERIADGTALTKGFEGI